MKRIATILAAASIAAPLPATATSVDTQAKALLAAAMIAGQEPCEFSIDHQKMLGWFDDNIPASEGAGFAEHLDMFVTADRIGIEAMGDTQRLLHCHSVKAKAADADWLSD